MRRYWRLVRGVAVGLKLRLAFCLDAAGTVRRLGASVGDDCRLLCGVGAFGSEPYLVSIGNHVTLASGVRLVTHDGGVWVFRKEYPEIDVLAPITIRDNVFVGLNSVILPGVTIGPNVVIGAGSVVTKDIPPGTVAAGTPARVLGTLEDYKHRSLSRATHTKLVSRQEKRQLLTRRFPAKADR